MARSRFDFNEAGFGELTHWLSQHHASATDTLLSLENPHSRLVDYLLVRGFTLYAPNPKTIARYRDARFSSKSDAADAQLIADHLREHHRHLVALHRPRGGVRALRLLLGDRDKLVQEQTRLKNQLVQTLKECFPESLVALGMSLLQRDCVFWRKWMTLRQPSSALVVAASSRDKRSISLLSVPCASR